MIARPHAGVCSAHTTPNSCRRVTVRTLKTRILFFFDCSSVSEMPAPPGLVGFESYDGESETDRFSAVGFESCDGQSKTDRFSVEGLESRDGDSETDRFSVVGFREL